MSDPKLIQNRYQLIEKLGQGGMGVVYKALDRLTGEQVALKQLRVSAQALDFASKAETDDTEKLRLGLASEFSILATLRHPHILSVLDFGFDESKRPYYTMTLLDGAMNFKNYALTQPEDTRYDLLLQVLQALHYLHRRGVLHRDLKPDNVLVTADGQVKVMDFGLAREETEVSQSSDSGKLFGTLHYMAPEVMHGQMASVAYDLYALGVMAYEVLFEKYPYADDTVEQLIMQVLSQPVDCSALPPKLDAWLTRLLAKDPAERPASAYDAMLDLYAALDRDIPPDNQTIRESFLQASTFVGREAELTKLTDALNKLETENSFFLIGGESGVGKSRLLNELRIQALVRGVTVLRGLAVEEGGLPFQVWRNIARRLLLIAEVTDLQAGILKDLVPDVGDLLGRDIPDAPELTGRAYQQRLVLTIVDLLREAKHPILLLLEDLQWAVESLEPLKQILLVQEQLPSLMVVANYRSDEAPNLPPTLTGMTSIHLERLDEGAVRTLCTSMLGERGVTDQLVQTIQRHSEGNTFFIVETMRAFAEESGGLANVTTAELPQGVFTGSMQELMRRRLGHIESQYAPIQTLAAIFGREIDTQLLAHLHEAASVDAWLSNATEYGVVSIEDNTWRFEHDKLREALLADIADETLPQIHRTAAETIEAVYPDDDDYNEALLRHWQQVGDLEKTYHYALPVAQNMIETTGAHSMAQALLQSLLDRLPPDDTRRIAPLNGLANSAWRQGNYDSGKTYAAQAQHFATIHDDLQGLATSIHNLGLIALNQADYERATDLFEQSLALFQQLEDQLGIAGSLNTLGMIVDSQGDHERARDLYQQSLVIRRQVGDQRGIAGSLNNLGLIALNQGDYEGASDLFEQSLALFQQLGDQRGMSANLNNLAIIASKQGNDDRASALYQQSLAIRQRLADQYAIAVSYINLGGIALNQGDYEGASDLFEQSLAIRQQLGDQSGISYNFMGLGQVAFKQGQTQAIQWFSRALLNAHHIGATPETLWAVVGIAGWLVQQGQAERAAQLVGLAQQHPAQISDIRDLLEEVMPLLEAALSPEDLKAMLERGQDLDLDMVVQELLAEFGDAEPDDKRAASTAQNNAPSLDAILVAALAQLNAASPDETIISVEAARQKLSAPQLAELEAKLHAIEASATGEDTIELGNIIKEVVTMLRDSNDM